VTEDRSNSELRIAGFGACMISGYPHKAAGMFEIGCGLIERNLSHPVQSTIVGLPAFSATRAEKYLQRKVLPFNRNYIVIQFGSTDAACPIWHHPPATQSSRFRNQRGADSAAYHARPATMLTLLHWELTSLIGYLMTPGPVTSLAAYIQAIEWMVKNCRAVSGIPVCCPRSSTGRATARVTRSLTRLPCGA
jgi:hypothetical protein